MSQFTAHIHETTGMEQAAEAHCRGAAEYASQALASVNLKHAAYLAGLVHDMGKFTRTFDDYIHRAHAGEPVRRGSVNHTFAGVRYLLTRYHHGPGDYVADYLVYAVGAHHGQFDCVDSQGKSGFDHRLSANIEYEEAVANFLQYCACEGELDDLYHAAEAELNAFFQSIPPEADDTSVFFYAGLAARLLLSAVIDGDRRDTAEFMTGQARHRAMDSPPDWRECLNYAVRKMDELPWDTPIQKARHALSEACGRLGEKPPGIYRLHLPTGAGKTLGALRAALAHAANRRQSRILLALLPF